MEEPSRLCKLPINGKMLSDVSGAHGYVNGDVLRQERADYYEYRDIRKSSQACNEGFPQ